MRNLISASAVLVVASLSSADIFTDASYDLFKDDLPNLDITSVNVSHTESTVTFDVTTRGFSDWSKYMILISSGGHGDGSNAWSRPVNQMGGNANFFIGSWVDQTSNNSQLVAYQNGGWNWDLHLGFSNSRSGNTVSWTVSRNGIGAGASNASFDFDVLTSGGGGNDAGVDHLSTPNLSMTHWGATSYSGAFLHYSMAPIPAPGAVALIGLAGLVARRRK